MILNLKFTLRIMEELNFLQKLSKKFNNILLNEENKKKSLFLSNKRFLLTIFFLFLINKR